ncbi:MAG: YebC/PmpR family DNA-binding transcriptional regulator [Candidatus Aminicenantes bacterium]|nr:YebC/PmpR family DNA-binding transcriptional regulator [Candidatus Aminicenantes bacterium]NIM85092.1 YebC/PmpR family DNA-binding transcriptional regulator [Candidatus Aminicenantes bacterium]NIN24599.1 YebC/PmpR family DNA-binding transcriptional regulator [Candidatus Aminicenantes bacterium]NIN48363.1 YebC/PmpR family DNA-binding transcriptional regulator [Candidatus Aminicenantes bacterium]NIN91266.1 YebC/PmpR family DNA-binding transcriptional regulator [Candidatus Aminicenantes bacteri
MSGHSKWHSIKHKKAAADAKRGKTFTRHIRELTYAAKVGGGDPDTNSALRHAIDAAKAVNMPADNIKKAIQRGTGELEGVSYESIAYEGYGPGGVAIMVECLTDNKNRTVADVRHVFSKYNGNLGESGCVSWMFTKKGMLIIPTSAIEEDELMEIVLDNGAEDMKTEGENYEVITAVEDFDNVLQAVKAKEIEMVSAEIARIPSTLVKLQGKQAEQMLKLAEKLEELDDIQNVWSNFDIPDEEIEAYSKNN